jgi:uncharacterized Zn finger protein
MSVPHLTEADLLRYASAETFRHGSVCYHQGAVLAPALYGTRLLAEVQTGAPLPAFVSCTFDANGSITATCTCQNVWGGWCKHMVAACLVLLHEPEAVEEYPVLETLLQPFNREELQALVIKLAGHIPHLAEALVKEQTLNQSALPQTQKTPVLTVPTQLQRANMDTKALRRGVRSAIHSLDRMQSSQAYGYVSSVVDEVGRLADQAMQLLETGDGRGALAALEAVTEEYIDEWENLDDSDGYAGDLFSQLGQLWAEVLLSVELSKKERKAWADELNTWQAEVDDYGIDEAFDIAATAALQGWDYPPLQRVLQGKITEQGAWDGEAASYAGDLAHIRLAILERQERFQEYLFLAEAEGQTEAYLTMLVRLDRAQEAFDNGLKQLTTPGAALTVASALCEHGEREQSLRLAEHGLTLEGRKAELAVWLRNQAEAMGQHDLALSAAEQAFHAQISLENYLHAAKLAGEQWETRKTALLEYARTTQSYETQGKIDVFLHEGLIDDAIAALGSYASHTIITQVVDVAIKERPEWAIQASKKQAESIMDAGKAQYYDAAATWLSKAHKAYQTLNRDDEWQAYLNGLLQLHGRKYKLVPLLKGIK